MLFICEMYGLYLMMMMMMIDDSYHNYQALCWMLYPNYMLLQSKCPPPPFLHLADEEIRLQRTALAQGKIASEWGSCDFPISDSGALYFLLFDRPTL